LAKKAILVWIFSSLTFIASAHLVEAIWILLFNGQIRLLSIYPFIGENLQAIAPTTYFWASLASTLILWGITCVVAFENPVEAFLNKILSDAKKQSAVETQLVEDKSEVIDLMNETIEANNETLLQVRDIIYNVRTEVKEIQSLKDLVEKVKMEIGTLKREVKRIEEKVKFPILCPACGKPLLPEFKMCPYCGEQIRAQYPAVIEIKDGK
jgi:rRNA maturation endonuclease Nob1